MTDFTGNLWTVGQTGESPFSNKNGQVWTEPKEHNGRDPFNHHSEISVQNSMDRFGPT